MEERRKWIQRNEERRRIGIVTESDRTKKEFLFTFSSANWKRRIQQDKLKTKGSYAYMTFVDSMPGGCQEDIGVVGSLPRRGERRTDRVVRHTMLSYFVEKGSTDEDSATMNLKRKKKKELRH